MHTDEIMQENEVSKAGEVVEFPKRIGLHTRAMQDIIRELQEDPSKFKSKSDMAEKMNMSGSHFSKVFKQETNQTPYSVVHTAKQARACTLLEESVLSIKEIAHRCGFKNPNHFSAWFKGKFDCSPTEYRLRSYELKEKADELKEDRTN